jgi:hypothetical protein
MAKDHRDELGPNSAGQSGDTQNLSNLADADSESVEELHEEGNDVPEVTTREVPEDDVPEEYRDDQNRDVA